MIANKAVIVKKFGDLEHTTIGPYRLPPLSGRIEVEVYYCGVNFSDLYTRLGFLPNTLPFVLGTECSGVITAVGVPGDHYKVGERVICYDYRGGMYSDRIRVLPECVFHIPGDIPLEVAASLFVNYLTAYFAVIEFGHLKPYETILINSCAGGVGSAATQIARTVKNVTIYGTASRSKAFYAEENGIDMLFSYNDVLQDLKYVEPYGVDVIVENQTANTVYDNISLLKPMGRIIMIGVNTAVKENHLSYLSLLRMWWKSWWFSMKDLVINNYCVAGLHLGLLLDKDRERVREALHYIFKLHRDGKIKPKIDSIWLMEDYHDAIRVLSSRKNIGKVLLKVR
ncbi:hypothetical protein Trydic_g23841 [Trypoxylus dichotomus]